MNSMAATDQPDTATIRQAKTPTGGGRMRTFDLAVTTMRGSVAVPGATRRIRRVQLPEPAPQSPGLTGG
jgi:hypothetical protein